MNATQSPTLFDAIRPGCSVRAHTPHGGQVSGRCVFKFPTHAVLNLGGRHGTPFVATPNSIVGVRANRRAALALRPLGLSR